MRAPPKLAACLEVCGELLTDEPEMRADLLGVFARTPPRWDLLPDDLQGGLADIAWDELLARGLAPAGARSFIERRVRRCEVCEVSARGEGAYDCEGCAGTGQEFVERRGERPWSLRAALTLAGDADAVLAAEALAREAAARLWPWRGRRYAIPGTSVPPEAIAWRVDEEPRSLVLMRGTESLCPLLLEALDARARARRSDKVSRALASSWWGSYSYNRSQRWDAAQVAAVDRAAAPFYDALVREGAEVPVNGPRGTMPRRQGRSTFAPVGRLFAELADPFPALCGLWDLGVAVERLEADTIVLARKAW